MIENQVFERKREFNQKAKNTMLAFINTDGGTLQIGVDDDGTIIGVNGDVELEARKISTGFRDSVTPDPSRYFKVEPEIRSDRYIINITVERGSVVPYCYAARGLVPQGVYVRVGSNTVTASREHIRQMIKDNGAGVFIAELSMAQNLTFECADKIFFERDVKFGIEQKRSLGLFLPDGRYNNLALILSDQCPYTTKAAIFEGLNKDRFKDRKEFSGSLFAQIEEVGAYLRVFNRINGTVDGMYRTDRPDYPGVAIREAYINALIHRDYYLEGSVLISMFDDRLEFVSLGGIMPGVTHDLMLAGVSVTRNEKLAQIFYRLNFIEAFGTGIPRIFAAYENNAVKPEIPVVDGGFLIRIPNMNYGGELKKSNETNNAGESMTDEPKTSDELKPKTVNERRIISEFSGVKFTKSDAAELLGISISGAYKLLRRMVDKKALNAYIFNKQWIYYFK